MENKIKREGADIIRRSETEEGDKGAGEEEEEEE